MSHEILTTLVDDRKTMLLSNVVIFTSHGIICREFVIQQNVFTGDNSRGSTLKSVVTVVYLCADGCVFE